MILFYSWKHAGIVIKCVGEAHVKWTEEQSIGTSSRSRQSKCYERTANTTCLDVRIPLVTMEGMSSCASTMSIRCHFVPCLVLSFFSRYDALLFDPRCDPSVPLLFQPAGQHGVFFRRHLRPRPLHSARTLVPRGKGDGQKEEEEEEKERP